MATGVIVVVVDLEEDNGVGLDVTASRLLPAAPGRRSASQ